MLSTRLRGKSLMAVCGIPLLSWAISHIRQSNEIDEIVVATSDQNSDDPLASFAKECDVKVSRGDKDDVLARFVNATSHLQDDDLVLRYTADNPMYDPQRTAEAFAEFNRVKPDYMHVEGLSHMIPEFITAGCLRNINQLDLTQYCREHVTVFLRQNENDFRIHSLPPDFAALRPEYDSKFTIDRVDQLDTFEEMINGINSDSPLNVGLDDCYTWLDKKNAMFNVPAKPGEKRMNLAGRQVGDGLPCFVIAEIGQNHNGQLNLAKKLIDMAARCNADAVKFQKREISWELTDEAYHRPYEGPNSFGRTYGLHREYLELDESQHRQLKDYALAQGLIYFCTPCDPPSVEMLERIGNPFYKVASRDITNIPLLQHIAKTGKPAILSTGMAGIKEIREALSVFESSESDVALMQCVSQYPAEPKNINLNAMQTMRDEFDVLVALSDHTPGVITGVAGAVKQAFAVEKHVTLSRAMPGTDHAAALEEEGLKRLVNYIRICEEAMGDGIKEFNPVAQKAKEKLARSLVSACEIPPGTELTEQMLILKSPGNGLTWNQRDRLLGKKAVRSIPSQSTLQLADFE